MNRHDSHPYSPQGKTGPLFASPEGKGPSSYATETRIVTTLALLVLGYYVLRFFDAWPSTLQRSLYEAFIYLLPSHAIHATQYAMVRLGRLPADDAKFRRADYGDVFAKQAALERMFGTPHMTLAFRKARQSFSTATQITLSDASGPPGLGNWDNSCYQNSVLQGMASLPEFLDYVTNSLGLCNQHNVAAATTSALDPFLAQLADPSGRRTTLWTPSVLKSMDSWQQQDAQEYFSRVLEAIEKEADRYVKSLRKQSANLVAENTRGAARKSLLTGTESPSVNKDSDFVSRTEKEDESMVLLKSAFQNPMDGLTAQGLECKTCGFTEGLSLTQFNCLTLNMGVKGDTTVESLLEEYTAPEEVDEVECEWCTKLAHGQTDNPGCLTSDPEGNDSGPKKRVQPVLRTKAKQITLARLPRDLVLHINRSIFDDWGNQRKNMSAVHVPPTLRFLARWCAPLGDDEDRVEAEYELKCVVTHYGRHDNGHYIALGKRAKDWYIFNDELVTKTTEQDVLGRGNGFMLFYEAKDQVRPLPQTEQLEPITAEIQKTSQALTSTQQVVKDEEFASSRILGASGDMHDTSSSATPSVSGRSTDSGSCTGSPLESLSVAGEGDNEKPTEYEPGQAGLPRTNEIEA